MGHTGRRDLIAYICLPDALDRNRKAVIFRMRGQPVLGGGGPGSLEGVQCVCLISPDTRPTYVNNINTLS